MRKKMMIDHLGRYALRGALLAANKERIEGEGKCCDNCDNCGGPYYMCNLTGKVCKLKGVCENWQNSFLSPLI